MCSADTFQYVICFTEGPASASFGCSLEQTERAKPDKNASVAQGFNKEENFTNYEKSLSGIIG